MRAREGMLGLPAWLWGDKDPKGSKPLYVSE